MLLSHETGHAGRPANHYLTPRVIRTPGAAACLLLLSLILGLLWATDASAQEFPPNAPGSWRLFIETDFPEVSNVAVGDVIDNLSVDYLNRFEDESIILPNTYSLWQVEPADAARVLTPLPSFPINAPIEIEFLRATTVTVRVRGYSGEEDPPETFAGISDANRQGNQLEFTFNVQSSTDATTGANTPLSALSVNERQAQTATDRLCATANANADPSPYCTEPSACHLRQPCIA